MAPLGNVTLKKLRDRARFRADSGDGAVSDDELNVEVNAAVRRLYGKRTAATPDDFATYSTPAQATLVSGAWGVAVPDNFFSLLRVDGGSDASNFYRLRRFMVQEELTAPAYQGALGRLRYQLRNGRVVLTPAPTTGVYLRLLYIPLLADLVADGDTCDFVNGWEDVVILDTAVRLLQREQNAAGALTIAQERDKRYTELQAEFAERDKGEPMHVADVRGWDE